MKENNIQTDYFTAYTRLVPQQNPVEALTAQAVPLKEFLATVSEEKSFFRYEAGKWSLKELLQHLIDCERIFCFRALAAARKEAAPHPGFEENDYAANSMAEGRSWQEMSEELLAVRAATNLLFKSFTADMLTNAAVFNGNRFTAGRAGLIIVGHVYHHIGVANERYLNG